MLTRELVRAVPPKGEQARPDTFTAAQPVPVYIVTNVNTIPTYNPNLILDLHRQVYQDFNSKFLN